MYTAENAPPCSVTCKAPNQLNFPSHLSWPCEKLGNWPGVWNGDMKMVVGKTGTLITGVLVRDPSLLQGSFRKDVFLGRTYGVLMASGASEDSALSLSASLSPPAQGQGLFHLYFFTANLNKICDQFLMVTIRNQI